MNMALATSFVSLGAFNYLPDSRSVLKVDSVDPEAERELIESIRKERVVREHAIDKLGRAAQIALAEGVQRGFIREREASAQRSALLQHLHAKAGGCEELRRELEERLSRARAFEQRARYPFPAEPPIKTLGRVTDKMAERLRDPKREWTDVKSQDSKKDKDGYAMEIRRGEVRQVLLRVQHDAPCVVRIVHVSHASEGRSVVLGQSRFVLLMPR
jgi:hypothetical protein